MNEFWFLLAIPFVILLFMAERRGQRQLRNWHPLPGGRTRLRNDLSVLLTMTLIGAAAYSSVTTSDRETLTENAPTLVLAVDVSPSMSATDVTPTRLDRAKAEIRQLVTALPGATFALLPFTGEAVEQLPFTNDRDALLFFVEQLAPGMVSAPGSAPAAAALHGQQLLAKETDRSGPQAVILFSDGERTLPGPPPDVLTTSPIHIVPLGSTAGAPFLNREGKTQLTRTNQPQLSQTQPDFLAALAKRSGGMIYPSDVGTFALMDLAEQYHITTPGDSTSPDIFLWLALGCWLLRYLPSGNKKNKNKVTIATILLLTGITACRLHEPAPNSNESAYHAYQTGDFATSARLYADTARLLDGTERAAALRNQGTMFLLQSKKHQAITILDSALLENPHDAMTRTNLALALRLADNDEAGATGSGDGESPNEQGATFSRDMALKLIENVTPQVAQDAPLTNVSIREVPVEKDW